MSSGARPRTPLDVALLLRLQGRDLEDGRVRKDPLEEAVCSTPTDSTPVRQMAGMLRKTVLQEALRRRTDVACHVRSQPRTRL